MRHQGENRRRDGIEIGETRKRKNIGWKNVVSSSFPRKKKLKLETKKKNNNNKICWGKTEKNKHVENRDPGLNLGLFNQVFVIDTLRPQHLVVWPQYSNFFFFILVLLFFFSKNSLIWGLLSVLYNLSVVFFCFSVFPFLPPRITSCFDLLGSGSSINFVFVQGDNFRWFHYRFVPWNFGASLRILFATFSPDRPFRFLVLKKRKLEMSID